MKRTFLLRPTWLTAALLLLVGCGGGAVKAPEATPTPAVTTTGGAIDIVPQGFVKGDLPPSLDAILKDADEMVVAAAAGNWSQVDAGMNAIDADWATFSARPEISQLPQDQMGAIDDAVHALGVTVKDHESRSTMRGANNLGALLAILAETYHPDLPPQISLLRVGERNLMLDAQDNDMVAADETLAQLQTTWQEIEDRVVANDGAEVAEGFAQAIVRQQAAEKAGDAKALEAEARAALLLVERMEGLAW